MTLTTTKTPGELIEAALNLAFARMQQKLFQEVDKQFPVAPLDTYQAMCAYDVLKALVPEWSEKARFFREAPAETVDFSRLDDEDYKPHAESIYKALHEQMHYLSHHLPAGDMEPPPGFTIRDYRADSRLLDLYGYGMGYKGRNTRVWKYVAEHQEVLNERLAATFGAAAEYAEQRMKTIVDEYGLHPEVYEERAARMNWADGEKERLRQRAGAYPTVA